MTPGKEGPPTLAEAARLVIIHRSGMNIDGKLRDPGDNDACGQNWELVIKILSEALERDEKRTAALEKVAEAANGEEVWRGIVASGMPGRWKTEDGEVQDANVQVDLFRNIKVEALKDLRALNGGKS